VRIACPRCHRQSFHCSEGISFQTGCRLAAVATGPGTLDGGLSFFVLVFGRLPGGSSASPCNIPLGEATIVPAVSSFILRGRTPPPLDLDWPRILFTEATRILRCIPTKPSTRQGEFHDCAHQFYRLFRDVNVFGMGRGQNVENCSVPTAAAAKDTEAPA
jgi:hypothetical protein